jgi:hypothetical protein
MADQRQSQGDPFVFVMIVGVALVISLVTGLVIAWPAGSLGAGLIAAGAGTISAAGCYVIGWNRGPKTGEGCFLYVLPFVASVVITASIAANLLK